MPLSPLLTTVAGAVHVGVAAPFETRIWVAKPMPDHTGVVAVPAPAEQRTAPVVDAVVHVGAVVFPVEQISAPAALVPALQPGTYCVDVQKTWPPLVAAAVSPTP